MTNLDCQLDAWKRGPPLKNWFHGLWVYLWGICLISNRCGGRSPLSWAPATSERQLACECGSKLLLYCFCLKLFALCLSMRHCDPEVKWTFWSLCSLFIMATDFYIIICLVSLREGVLLNLYLCLWPASSSSPPALTGWGHSSCRVVLNSLGCCRHFTEE